MLTPLQGCLFSAIEAAGKSQTVVRHTATSPKPLQSRSQCPYPLAASNGQPAVGVDSVGRQASARANSSEGLGQLFSARLNLLTEQEVECPFLFPGWDLEPGQASLAFSDSNVACLVLVAASTSGGCVSSRSSFVLYGLGAALEGLLQNLPNGRSAIADRLGNRTVHCPPLQTTPFSPFRIRPFPVLVVEVPPASLIKAQSHRPATRMGWL